MRGPHRPTPQGALTLGEVLNCSWCLRGTGHCSTQPSLCHSSCLRQGHLLAVWEAAGRLSHLFTEAVTVTTSGAASNLGRVREVQFPHSEQRFQGDFCQTTREKPARRKLLLFRMPCILFTVTFRSLTARTKPSPLQKIQHNYSGTHCNVCGLDPCTTQRQT